MKVLYIQPGDRPWFEPEKFVERKKMYLSRAQFEVGIQIPREYEVKFLDLNVSLKQGFTVGQAVHDSLLINGPDVAFVSFPTFVQGEQIETILSSIQSASPTIKVVLGGSVMPLIQKAPLRWWGKKISCAYMGWGREIPQLIKSRDDWSNPVAGATGDTRQIIDGYSPEEFYSAGGRLDFAAYVATCKALGIIPMGNVEMTRGCPFSCDFCSLNSNRMPFQVRTPRIVLREIEFLLSSGVEYIHIIDPTFGSVKKESEILVTGMQELHSSFPQSKFEILTRSELVTEELAQKLARAGVVRCGVGMESMDMKSLDSVNKNSSPLKTERAVKILSRNGIQVKLFHILFPGKFSTETISFFSRMSTVGVDFIVQSSFLRDLPNPKSEPHFLEQDQTFFVPARDSVSQAMEWLLANLAFPSMDTGVRDQDLRSEIQGSLAKRKSLERMFIPEGDRLRLGDYTFEPGPLVPIAERVFKERR